VAVNRPARALAVDRVEGLGRDQAAEGVPGWDQGQGRAPDPGKHRDRFPQLKPDLFSMSYAPTEEYGLGPYLQTQFRVFALLSLRN
jgi:hypothetical protein